MDGLAWLVQPVLEAVAYVAADLLWCPANRSLDAERIERARRLIERCGTRRTERGQRLRARLTSERRTVWVDIDGRAGRVRLVTTCDRGERLDADPRHEHLPEWLASLRRVGGVERVRCRPRTLVLVGTLALAGDLAHVARVLDRLATTRDRRCASGPYRGSAQR